ncbi:MAG: YidC/Oxa1 family membrane protein insertase [Clostridia bacterium]|nr:YidC/Oxa1 family membrane protein insertase [Clostridia bacterium]
MGRIALITVAVLLLLTTLVGCAGGTTISTLTLNEDVFSLDKDEMAKHELEPSELKQIAKMLQSAYAKEQTDKAEYNSYEMLVAANRGYDMTASDFKEEGEMPDVGVNLEAAANVIVAANAKATENNLTDPQKETVREKLNAADVELLISAFRTEVTAEESDIWAIIFSAIGTVLSWMTVVGFGNYVVGICIFAILIEILMLPFGIKQQKNSIKQAKLRPKEMAIKNKYKGRNDQPTMQKMQAEIQELYQRENFSPASGCLPLLVQLPIIMVLYNIVMDPLRYVLGQSASVSAALSTYAGTARAAGGLGLSFDTSRGSIELLSKLNAGDIDMMEGFQFFSYGEGVLDSLKSALSAVPNFNIGPINFGLAPLANGFGDWMTWVLLLIPVLTFVTYFITSKLNRKLMYQSVANEGMDARQMACSNSMMDITMPAMSAFFTLYVPAVIGVYWAFRSWVTLLKSFILSKMMPLPTFTEEDYKAAAKEMAGKKATAKKSSNAGKVRSLHYIDDEDFEDTRERGLARRAAIEEREREEQAKKAQKTPFGAVPMKKDKPSEQQKAEDAPVENETAQASEASDTNDTQDNDNNKDEV